MWAWAAAQYRFGTVQENSVHPCLKDTVFFFFFNYTKFPDFILSYQRHKMPAHSDQKKAGRKPARKVPVGLGQCWGQLRVLLPVCPSAPLIAGGGAGQGGALGEACARVRSMGALRGRPSGIRL